MECVLACSRSRRLRGARLLQLHEQGQGGLPGRGGLKGPLGQHWAEGLQWSRVPRVSAAVSTELLTGARCRRSWARLKCGGGRERAGEASGEGGEHHERVWAASWELGEGSEPRVSPTLTEEKMGARVAGDGAGPRERADTCPGSGWRRRGLEPWGDPGRLCRAFVSPWRLRLCFGRSGKWGEELGTQDAETKHPP